MRLSGWIASLFSAIYVAGLDLAIWVDSRVDPRAAAPKNARPWWGLLVVVLLIAGLLFLGETGLWIVREAAPHRETTP